MAPIKPTPQQKKKRTFFSSKLNIKIPTPIPKLTENINTKKSLVVGTGIVLDALKGLDDKSIKNIGSGSKDVVEVKAVKDRTTNTDVVESKSGTSTVKKAIEKKKNIIVYSSKTRSKSKSMITRKQTSIKNSIIGKPIRAVTRKAEEIKKGSNNKIVSSSKTKAIVTTRSMGSRNKPKVKVVTIKSSKKPTKTTSNSSTSATKTTTTNKSKSPLIPSSNSSLKSTSNSVRETLSKRIIQTYTSKLKTPQSELSTSAPLSNVVPSNSSENTINKKISKPLKKDYMTAGFYCQDPNPSSSKQLHNRILTIRSAEEKALKATQNASSSSTTRNTRNNNSTRTSTTKSKDIVPVIQERPTFPPLPYDHGYEIFFKQENEFILPYYILKEKEDGKLVEKKKPGSYQKLRGNVYPERIKVSADFEAICKCSPESKCADQCINRIMSYLCGKSCPSGDECTNKTLTKRKGASYKVVYTGARGFGIVLTQDVKEGDFVIDYRGEVIAMDTFMDRIQDEYKGSKNFYALAYDQDEVIDAGMKGNDARFINHGCSPNLEVRKYQTAGDGWEEFEVGMWALRDISAGEELFYDYNFESFGVAAQSDDLRTKCCCGAPNCIGFLGRKSGEKTAKELAAEIASKAAELARKGLKGGKKLKKLNKKPISSDTPLGERRNGTRAGTNVLGLEGTPSIISNTDSSLSLDNSILIRTPSEVGPFVESSIKIISSSPTTEVDTSPKDTIKYKRKSEGLNVPEIQKKKSRKSEPAPTTTPSLSTCLSKKNPRQSDPIPTVPTSPVTSTANKKVDTPRTKSTTSKQVSIPTPLPQPKRPRKSEPIPSIPIIDEKSRRNPRISMDLVREAARIKKEQDVKARKGAPKGWAIVPLEPRDNPEPAPVVGGRRPPRDRSSLG